MSSSFCIGRVTDPGRPEHFLACSRPVFCKGLPQASRRMRRQLHELFLMLKDRQGRCKGTWLLEGKISGLNQTNWQFFWGISISQDSFRRLVLEAESFKRTWKLCESDLVRVAQTGLHADPLVSCTIFSSGEYNRCLKSQGKATRYQSLPFRTNKISGLIPDASVSKRWTHKHAGNHTGFGGQKGRNRSLGLRFLLVRGTADVRRLWGWSFVARQSSRWFRV